MTLPVSGPISMAAIAAEIGISAVGLSLNDSRVRQLAGKPSGPVSFSDLRGKSWLTIELSFATDTESGTGANHTFAPGKSVTVTGLIGTGTLAWTFEGATGGSGTWAAAPNNAADATLSVNGTTDIETTYTVIVRCTVTDSATGESKSDTGTLTYNRLSS